VTLLGDSAANLGWVADERVGAAIQAFIYGYPLEYCVREIAKFPAGTASVLPGVTAFNTFGYARELLGPEAEFVSPNNDTLYVIAPCDVRHGPVRLHVPDTGGRYYVLQFVDAWTNNFAYLGRRATGTAAADYLLVAADWDGEEPDDVSLVRAPTGIFIIVGRVQVDGESDLVAARALQDQFTLTPAEGSAQPTGIPSPDPRVPEELAFWERLRVAVQAFPPPTAEAEMLARLEPLGLLSETSPYLDPHPNLTDLLVGGQAEGEASIEQLMKNQPASATGWQPATHIFDYNVHALEIGTIDAPEWKIEEPDRRFATRAVAARAGLWGNHGYEAAYFSTYKDSAGEPLDGSLRYELRLSTPPPVDAFWSLTMYDAPRFYLVANAIDRYSIGDRTAGLVVDDNGGVIVYLQRDRPTSPDAAANWLPTPDGPFRPILRMYQPRQSATDGTYQLPAINRIE
jgi:hypothetical protein